KLCQNSLSISRKDIIDKILGRSRVSRIFSSGNGVLSNEIKIIGNIDQLYLTSSRRGVSNVDNASIGLTKLALLHNRRNILFLCDNVRLHRTLVCRSILGRLAQFIQHLQGILANWHRRSSKVQLDAFTAKIFQRRNISRIIGWNDDRNPILNENLW